MTAHSTLFLLVLLYTDPFKFNKQKHGVSHRIKFGTPFGVDFKIKHDQHHMKMRIEF